MPDQRVILLKADQATEETDKIEILPGLREAKPSRCNLKIEGMMIALIVILRMTWMFKRTDLYILRMQRRL